jgi:glycosyltransferase involved in cell wall biosynthesis
VSGAFRATKSGGDDEVLDRLGLEEGFVFSLPAEMREVELFLAAWTWVDSSAGQLHPLVMAGLKERDRQNAMKRADELDLGETVRILERVNLKDLPALYRGGKVFLHGQSFGWGQELRWALACGTPVAGVRSALTVEIVQEAGYLVDPLDSRGLAAACITLLVEDEISSRLRQLGLIRARGFHEKGHIAALERSFEELLG